MLERLEDYLARQGGARHRVWLSQVASRAISDQFGVSTRVIIRDSSLTVYCSSQAAAAKLKLAQSRLINLLADTDQGLTRKRLAIKVEPSSWGPTDSPAPG
mgnify:FL=1